MSNIEIPDPEFDYLVRGDFIITKIKECEEYEIEIKEFYSIAKIQVYSYTNSYANIHRIITDICPNEFAQLFTNDPNWQPTLKISLNKNFYMTVVKGVQYQDNRFIVRVSSKEILKEFSTSSVYYRQR